MHMHARHNQNIDWIECHNFTLLSPSRLWMYMQIVDMIALY